MNRRNFLHTVGVTLAALVTRKWPEIEWPEPVKRAAARIIYVDAKTGSDANNGKRNSPLRTLSAALNMVTTEPGTIIDIRAGNNY